MPIFYMRRLTGIQRTDVANQHIARYLAFVAGAVNAGGFLAIHQYTSHMSGIVATIADNLVLGKLTVVADGAAAVVSFLAGALTTTLLIRWGRNRDLESAYALPLMAEAFLLVLFGLEGKAFTGNRALGTIVLLCFTMGLQNATITKLSNAVIRTTHVTGMITDVGIALGRMLSASYEKLQLSQQQISATNEFAAIKLLSFLIILFFIGGITGAMGFKWIGFYFTFPLAAILAVLSAVPVLDDLRGR